MFYYIFHFNSTFIIIIIKQSHKALQKWMRKFVDEIIIPDAIAREKDGKRCSDSVVQKMSYVYL